MIRTQIRLSEEQARRLRAIANREGITLAEVIRRCVDAALSELEPEPTALYARAAGLVGRFKDKPDSTDLAAEHDRYLDETYRR